MATDNELSVIHDKSDDESFHFNSLDMFFDAEDHDVVNQADFSGSSEISYSCEDGDSVDSYQECIMSKRFSYIQSGDWVEYITSDEMNDVILDVMETIALIKNLPLTPEECARIEVSLNYVFNGRIQENICLRPGSRYSNNGFVSTSLRMDLTSEELENSRELLIGINRYAWVLKAKINNEYFSSHMWFNAYKRYQSCVKEFQAFIKNEEDTENYKFVALQEEDISFYKDLEATVFSDDSDELDAFDALVKDLDGDFEHFICNLTKDILNKPTLADDEGLILKNMMVAIDTKISSAEDGKACDHLCSNSQNTTSSSRYRFKFDGEKLYDGNHLNDVVSDDISDASEYSEGFSSY